MASLSSMPVEILERIIESAYDITESQWSASPFQLSRNYSAERRFRSNQQSLCRIATTNRTFHAITRRLIYRGLDVNGRAYGAAKGAAMLLRTLEGIPTAGQHARELRLSGFGHDLIEWPHFEPGELENLPIRIVDHCTSLRRLVAAPWDPRLFEGARAGTLAQNLDALSINLEGDKWEEDLREVLSRSTRLKVFECDIFGPGSMDVSRLSRSLVTLSTTLRELHLRVWAEGNAARAMWRKSLFGTLCLTDFPCLERLVVEMWVLLGCPKLTRASPEAFTQCLPLSLRYLEVSQDRGIDSDVFHSDEGVMAVYRGYLAGERLSTGGAWVKQMEPLWKSATPELAEVVVTGVRKNENYLPFWFNGRRKALRKICRSQGIKHSILEDMDPCRKTHGERYDLRGDTDTEDEADMEATEAGGVGNGAYPGLEPAEEQNT